MEPPKVIWNLKNCSLFLRVTNVTHGVTLLMILGWNTECISNRK